MTLTQIKQELGILQLNLNSSPNNPKWLNHFENGVKIAISLHQDLYDELVVNGDKVNLMTQIGERVFKVNNKEEEFTTFRIVKTTREPEFTL